jgi:hypothetical protein
MDASLQLGAVNVTNSSRDARKHACTLFTKFNSYIQLWIAK